MGIKGKNIKDYYREMMSIGDEDKIYNGHWLNWYHRYECIIDRVKKRKLKLNQESLDANKDRKFLELLLLKRDNGIARAIRGGITKVQFENFIIEPNIIKAIENIMQAPSAEANKKLGDAIRQCNIDNNHKRGNQRIENNWLITNRVAAACTPKVSSTVDPGRFIDVFGILNGLLPTPYKSPLKKLDEREWFMENLHLMSELQKIFPKTESLLLNIFVWQVWEDNFE